MKVNLISVRNLPELDLIHQISGKIPLLIAFLLMAGGGGFLPAAPALPSCPPYKSICITAQRHAGVDMKTGTAVLEGGVQGELKEQQITFSSQSLRAFRNANGEWMRLVLEKNVRINQPQGKSSADYGNLEPDRFTLQGNVTMSSPPNRVEGDFVMVEKEKERITIKGKNTKHLLIYHQGPPKKGKGKTKPHQKALQPEKPLIIKAIHAVIDKTQSRITLSGSATVEREGGGWMLSGEHIRLDFEKDNALKSFYAEGNARILQPGRSLTADVAQSKNDNKTIRLSGKAAIHQEGQFGITSEQIDVYSDARKGVVQSGDRQQPIRLALDPKTRAVFRLDKLKMNALLQKGVPQSTLAKLETLYGKSFAKREELDEALSQVLTPRELQQYSDKIATQAK